MLLHLDADAPAGAAFAAASRCRFALCAVWAVARVTHIVAKYALRTLVVVVVGLVGTLQAGSTMKCLALPSDFSVLLTYYLLIGCRRPLCAVAV